MTSATWFEFPGPHRRRRGGAADLLVALAVAGLLLSGLAGWWVIGGSGGGGRGWDPRILAIARFVERDRGLTFDRPVPVAFLSPAAFRARIAAQDRVTAADRAGLDEQASELRALGLAAGAVDLGRLESEADQASTVGYYDAETKRLYVEGTRLTPYVRVTVAHELTHALQDQRLGLARLDDLPDDQQPAVSALVEGDAVTVEQDYRATLSDAEEGAYEREEAALGGTGPAALPEAVADSESFPYEFGPAFVDALLAAGGNRELDAAFSHPPTAEAQVVDPASYLGGRRVPALPAPALPAGARRLEPPAAFGQVSLAEAMGARLGYGAWGAVQGWAADSSVLYRAGGRTCIAISTRLDSPAAASTLGGAERRWVAGLPAARVSSTGQTVRVDACDPGAGGAALAAVQPTVHDILVARADLMDDPLGGPVTSAEEAQCVADQTIAAIGTAGAVAHDQGQSGAPTDAQVHAAERRAEPGCSGSGT